MILIFECINFCYIYYYQYKTMIKFSNIVYCKQGERAPEKTENLLSRQIVWMQNEAWQKESMKEIILLIKQWKLQSLHLKNNKYKGILKELISVNFPSLKKLNICGNRIESIEGINRFCFPSLQIIDLASNNIREITALRQGTFPNLMKLSLSENHIMDSSAFQKMHQYKIVTISVEQDWVSIEQYFDIGWSLKLQVMELRALYINSKKRIRRRSVYECLRRRFKYIKVLSKY